GAGAGAPVVARIPETYQWPTVPIQQTPQAPAGWQAIRLTGQDALAVRASKKLKQDELLVTALGATRLRMELDRVPLWRGDHVSVQQLINDFGSYLYLPRLQGPQVLTEAIQNGLPLLTWEQDSFVYAESYDDRAGRYRGLRAGQHVTIGIDDRGLLVKPAVARAQLEAERPTEVPGPGGGATGGGTPPTGGETPGPTVVGLPPGGDPPGSPRPTRYHGSVSLDPTRVGRDAGRIGEEVIAHLTGVVGARVRVTLEIEADVPGGVPENVVRIVTENSRALKFESHGFEEE